MYYLFEALHGTAIRYAAEKRNPAESIAELREIANGHDDILAEAAGTTAGSWYASPVTRVGHELIAVGMLILTGGGAGRPPNYVELERWSRVGFQPESAALSTGSAITQLAFLNGTGAERASWSRQSADPIDPLPLRTVRVLRFSSAIGTPGRTSWLSPPWPSWSRWCSGSGARRGIAPASDLMEGRDVLESRF
jgi:hypothetical protein